MLTAPEPNNIADNPLLDSPFYQQDNLKMGNFPINNNWILLSKINFSTLAGPDWAFLGP